MEKLSSCQNHKKNVTVRLLQDFIKIMKKRSLERKNKQEKHSVD